MSPRSLPEWTGRTDDAMPSAKVKLRIVNRQRPAAGELPVCPLCGQPIREGDGMDFDHATPLIDGGENTESNLRAVHRKCHRLHTARQALERTAARDHHKRAYGLKAKRPIPGSKASGWRKRMDGTVERRR